MIYYFGCIDRIGHYMWMSEHSRGDVLATNPWAYNIDGGLCPKDSTVAGIANVAHKDGWTAVAFWDYSFDKRGNSNSAILVDRVATFEEVIEEFKNKFPNVYRRFDFTITCATPQRKVL